MRHGLCGQPVQQGVADANNVGGEFRFLNRIDCALEAEFIDAIGQANNIQDVDYALIDLIFACSAGCVIVRPVGIGVEIEVADSKLVQVGERVGVGAALRGLLLSWRRSGAGVAFWGFGRR